MKKKKSEPYDVVMMLRILVLQRLYTLQTIRQNELYEISGNKPLR